MKIEPIGCFTPYEYIPPIPIALPLTNMTCDICPGINADSHMVEGICKCRSGQYWNGVECVARDMYPCVVNQLTYGVGAQFEGDNCGQCTCVLGGIVQCKQRECPPCGNGLRRILSPACLCQCEPCPANEILCQTSGTCIAESKWCDGVQDCPDDELNCSHKSQSTQKTYEIVKEYHNRVVPLYLILLLSKMSHKIFKSRNIESIIDDSIYNFTDDEEEFDNFSENYNITISTEHNIEDEGTEQPNISNVSN